MPRRRARITTDAGLFNPERVSDAIDRYLDLAVGERSAGAEEERAFKVPKGVGGAGGASTGFGRRAFDADYSQVQWDPEVPYPQMMPTRTSDQERPRTIAAGYDDGNAILRVTFRNGVEYEYLDVPPHVWNSFQRVPSPGRLIDDVLSQYFYRPRGED